MTKVPLADWGVDMFIGLLGFLICIGLINLLKELSNLTHHFLQLSNIFLYFLNSYIGWLAGIEDRGDTEFTPKLEADILQSSNYFVNFLPKD
jgi:hypothetical protein